MSYSDRPFFDVETSLSARAWRGLNADVDRLAAAMGQETGLPDALTRVLARLGVSAQDAPSYLEPRMRDLMPDPDHLRDMAPCLDRLSQAIARRERIAIFADYDVDGAASAALLTRYLAAFSIAPEVYIPDRISEGYGPNAQAMKSLAANHDLIICVDCGTISFEPIAAVKGTDVIVIDHHLGAETLPEALAIVNPNRQDENSALGYLCAAGLVFMVLVGLNRNLRNTNHSAEKLPDLVRLLDLVALATIADVAPLVGLNRAFVRQGLRVMAKRENLGLCALGDVAGLTSAPTPYHLGFLFGPRINAGGRIGEAKMGYRLLVAQTTHEADALAEELNRVNQERRDIEAATLIQAQEQAEHRGLDGPLVWAAGKDWHPGVVGIVASRLKEAANRPAIVLAIANGQAQGSGRSVSGIDLGTVVAKAVRQGHLIRGGGHKMAAGLTIAEDQIETAMGFIAQELAHQGADRLGTTELKIDATLAPGAITTELIEAIESAGPFGAGAPAPRFVLPFMQVRFAKRAGENHLRLTLSDDHGSRIDAIAFRAFDSALGPALEDHKGAVFHVAGRLEIDQWGGRYRPKLRLEDAALATR